MEQAEESVVPEVSNGKARIESKLNNKEKIESSLIDAPGQKVRENFPCFTKLKRHFQIIG